MTTNIWEKIREALLKTGVSESDVSKITDTLKHKMNDEAPPKIALIGQCGVGKSSTINALFNAGRPTSHFEPCTQDAESTIVTTNKGKIEIYDMPGLGEGIKADKRHIQTYKKILPIVDVAVWIITAGDRQFKMMQESILQISSATNNDYLKKIIFAINKADIMYPNNWNNSINAPSQEQQLYLQGFSEIAHERINEVAPDWNGTITVYSALKRYHLQELLLEMVKSTPKSRRWVINKNADVADYLGTIDPRILATATSLLNEEQASKKHNDF